MSEYFPGCAGDTLLLPPVKQILLAQMLTPTPHSRRKVGRVQGTPEATQESAKASGNTNAPKKQFHFRNQSERLTHSTTANQPSKTEKAAASPRRIYSRHQSRQTKPPKPGKTHSSKKQAEKSKAEKSEKNNNFSSNNHNNKHTCREKTAGHQNVLPV